MVVFTCGHCGESVQKPKVEKHYLTKCRNRNPNLSCMDCFKDFFGKDYEAHTKCITEEERYSGKGFQAKEKKGEKKQETWVEMLQSVLDEQTNAPRNVLRIIETVSKHNNTPRKKPKFINFVKNVCGPKTNPKDIDQAWDYISVKLSELSNANAQSRNQNKNKKAETNGKSEDDGDGDIQNGEESEKQDETSQINGSSEGHKDSANDEEDVEENQSENEVKEQSANKKLSKKQRKEEKKRKKYEAELQSAVAPPPEDEEVFEEQPTKKGKKKKTKSESNDGEEPQDGKNKKKRKRQDTTNSVPEIQENGADDNVENVIEPVITKASKKKQKVEDEELDEGVCLHDQNVAKIEELSMNPQNFNWHAVIRSVLEKKGNEVPFKRLQKKVLMEYSDATGHEVDDRIAEKFIKRLKSAPNVRVIKNSVILEL